MRVRLIDLERLHAPIRAELDAAIARVVDSARFVLGPEVAAFEQEVAAFSGVAHAVAVSSGSDAILCGLWADGIGQGDEVLTPAFSFAAAAEAIARLGARPVFADIDENACLDASSARAHLTPRTRAIVAVDLFGRRAQVAELASLGVPIHEDAAQAIGAPHVASAVRAAAVSFFPTKNLGALGDGGVVLTEHADLADSVRLLRAHGAKTKYVHERLGWNMRLDELQAAVLRAKLSHLRAWNQARRRIAAAYRDGLSGMAELELPSEDDGHVWHQFVVMVEGRRDALRAYLAERGVETEIYYPLALHLQPCFAALGGRTGEFPRAESACRRALALPIHPSLRADEISYVVDAVRSFFGAR